MRHSTSLMYNIDKNGGHATASALQAHVISVASQMASIDAFIVQNAEKLSYADNSFDYTFIKETFHHLTRPHAAVHEILHVSTSTVNVQSCLNQQTASLMRSQKV